MNGIKDLFDSERGLFALAIVIAATALTALHNMTIDQWQTLTTSIFGIYVGGKTVTTAVGLFRRPVTQDVAPTPTPAPTEPTS